ncbi:MAG TPA: hypothetical protein VHB79_10360 [Polyangiaceae bacterium]|nr:hypothetical protein [Polyangiaceae bacterium]
MTKPTTPPAPHLMTREQRLAGLRNVASGTGRTVAEVAKSLVPTLGLDAIEAAWLQHQADQEPERLPPDMQRSIQRGAARAETDAAAKGMIADVRAFRTYEQTRQTDPFAAARMRQGPDGGAIERGRFIDSDDSGPDAA